MADLFGTELVIWLQQTLGPEWAPAMRTLTLLGASWGVMFAAGLALWLRGRALLYALLGLVLLETACRTAIASLTGVPRPDSPDIVRYVSVGDSFAFPSGHVSTATAAWGLPAVAGALPPWVAVLIIAAVGVTRIYLGAHRLGDVLGGIVLGALLIGAWVMLWPRLRAWLAARSFRFFLWLAALALVVIAGAGLAYLGDSPSRWRGAGLFAGAAVAMPLEWRYVRYSPRPARPLATLAMIGVGLLGILPLLAVDRAFADAPLALGAALTFSATLWALLAAPAVYVRLGWSAQRAGGGS